MTVAPVSVSPPTHLARAFGWNLGKVVPSQTEAGTLAAAGVTDAAVQRYAAWRRNLLIVAFVPTLLAAVLATFDTFESDLGELTRLGVGLEIAWLVASYGLAAACLAGIWTWTRPGRAAGLLAAAWAGTFVLTFVYALLPVGVKYNIHDLPDTPPAAASKPAPAPAPSADTKAKTKAKDEDDDEEEDEEKPAVPLDPDKLEKLQAVEELAVEVVLSGEDYLFLFPVVLSLIPGVVNGCLRIKALIPAAQLPGWLLVCAAPSFLLFWVVILVIANQAANNPFLVFGVLLWAGAPIWYSVRGRVFVQSQIGDAEAARIAGVKRFVGLTTLVGVGLLIAFALSAKVVGLHVVGFDRAKAVSTKIEELSEEDDEVSFEDVKEALAESKSFVYAFDLSSWRMVVDFLAKLLVVTAVFADLVLRATVSAWRNDRSLRARDGASEYDTTAAAASGLFGAPV
jgi:hypothetical protein